jgi:hypothetical protein
VPPNLSFEIDDLEENWTFKPESVDFLHSRQMYGIKDWPRYFQQAFTVLKPGGYFEVVERGIRSNSDDGSMPEDCALRQFQEDSIAATEKIGRSMHVGPKVDGWLRDAGFTVVSSKVSKIPLGDWPADPIQKQIGAFMRVASLSGIEGYALKIQTTLLKRSPEEAQARLVDIRKDLVNKKYHSYSML